MTLADHHDPEKFRSQLLPLFFLTSIFFLNFTIRIIISPLLPTITEDMNLTRDQAGSFFLISASGYFIALLCSGFVSSRLLHKKTIALAAIGSGMALAAAGLSQNLMAMRLGLFGVGMASALYLPSGIAVLTSSTDTRNWGKAIGIHELAPNLSFLLTPVICEGLLLWLSWRNVLLFVGVTSIFLGFAFYKFSTVKDFKGESPHLKSFLPLAATPSFWMMMALFTAGVTGTLGVYSMLPLYLVKEHGLLQTEANTLMTLSRMFTLPMPFVVGWLSDRFGLKPILAVVLLITGLSTLLLGVFTGSFLTVIIFIQPLSSVSFFPPAFAALSLIGSRETRNIMVSFTIPIAFLIGGGLVPNLIGIFGENDFFPLGFMLAGGFIMAGAALPAFLKFREEHSTL
jgi:NNP family nitrate/nitrite transporter-like MFS transporter